MLIRFCILFVVLAVSGCAELLPPPEEAKPENQTERPVPRPEKIATPSETAVTAEQFDTTTPEQRQAATAQPAVQSEVEIGRTIASLGNPANPGFWLETTLVDSIQQGRVVYPPSGQSVAVELIPIVGPKTAGSRISLPAIRLLGAPLTGLPELIVFAGS